MIYFGGSKKLKENVAIAVKKLIVAKGITSEQAANEIGISTSIFSDVIRSRPHLSHDSLQKIRVWISKQQKADKTPEVKIKFGERK